MDETQAGRPHALPSRLAVILGTFDAPGPPGRAGRRSMYANPTLSRAGTRATQGKALREMPWAYWIKRSAVAVGPLIPNDCYAV